MVAIENRELIHSRAPVTYRHRPFLRDVLQGHEHKLHRGVGSREALSVLGDLPDREIQRLDRVGRIDHLADCFRKLEERRQFRPSGFPGPRDHGILGIPPFRERLQFIHRHLFRGGRIGFLEVGGNSFPVFERHELQGIADHVDDAQLPFRFGEHRRDQDILQPPVLQFVQNPEPELGAFGLVDPEPQKLLVALQIDRKGHVDRFLGNFSISLTLITRASRKRIG